jgi:hypothetical protein
MPQRASQRKFGKAWNYTWLTKGTEARGNMKQIYVEEKSVRERPLRNEASHRSEWCSRILKRQIKGARLEMNGVFTTAG